MNTEILIESKTARDGQLAKVSHESAADTLSKAKALVFALWQGTGAATTEQMADYYEVPAETVRTVFKRHRDELDSDGVKVLRGKALSEAKFIMNLAPNTDKITIWTPRAALRLGMLLRDSTVAQQVRTVLLDVAEKVAEPSSPKTTLELVVMLAQETVKLEGRVNEHSTAIAQLTSKVNRLSSRPQRAKSGLPKNLTPELTQKILTFAEERGGTVTGRDTQRSFYSGGRPDAATVKAWFRELESLGYGKTAVVGKSFCFTLKPQLTVVN